MLREQAQRIGQKGTQSLLVFLIKKTGDIGSFYFLVEYPIKIRC